MNKAVILLVLLLIPFVHAEYNTSYDLTDTINSWVSADYVDSMEYDANHNIVFLGTYYGKLGYYNVSSNTSVDLTPTIVGDWTTGFDIYSMTYDDVHNKLYFVFSQVPVQFGVYDFATNTSKKLVDLSTYLALVDYDSTLNVVWFSSDDGTLGAFFPIFNSTTIVWNDYYFNSNACIKFDNTTNRVYMAFYNTGYNPRYFDINSLSMVTLTFADPSYFFSCDLDQINQILYFGAIGIGTTMGYYNLSEDMFHTIWGGDVYVMSTTYMPNNNMVFFGESLGWDAYGEGEFYNISSNTSFQLSQTDLTNFWLDGRFAVSIYDFTDNYLFMSFENGDFGFYDNNGTTSIFLCEENWITVYGFCEINDSYLKYYIDNNSCGTFDDLPVDNGTYEPCNYCSQDIQPSETECFFNGTINIKNISFIDNNLYSCCAMTNISSDCDILSSPYNETNQTVCNIPNDFEILNDPNCDFGILPDKCYWNINLNQTNTTFNCISYVKTASGNLLQSNPVYTQKSDATIQFTTGNYEDREYFYLQNGIGQVYFTKENLIFDGRQYIFGVQCADNADVYTTERYVQVGYENVNSPTTRFFWAIGNISGLTLALIIAIIILIILAALIYMFKRRS